MADHGAEARARGELVETVGHFVRDARVLQAMRDVPRHRFVPLEFRAYAYDDTALAIGAGQTISQPTVVATMTEAAALTGTEHVLEIGTGSGYQVAVLARLATDVVSVEVVDELRQRAAALLEALGIDNVQVLPAGDTLGAPEYAPYDAILVTAAMPRVPPVLVDQLRLGGRLVAPVGSIDSQRLLVGTRGPSGLETRFLGVCRFVPLVGPEGFVPGP